MGREWEGTDTDEDNDNNNMTSHCDSLVKAPLIASRDLGKRQGSARLNFSSLGLTADFDDDCNGFL